MTIENNETKKEGRGRGIKKKRAVASSTTKIATIAMVKAITMMA